MQSNEQQLRQALTSAVGDIAKRGYAVAADARLQGVEIELKRWTALTKEEKSKLWAGMQTGRFVLYAGSMTFLMRCAEKSAAPTWNLANGQSMRTGGDDDFELFGLESAQLVLDNSWMSPAQVQRLEASRAGWVELHRSDLAVLVDKVVNASENVISLSQREMRVLLREARQIWNDEQSYLSEPQKSSLQLVISSVWGSIRPKWWEFGLRSRPKEFRE